MFDVVLEFVGEIVGGVLLEGSCALISGTVLGLADLDNRPVSLDLNSGVDDPESSEITRPAP